MSATTPDTTVIDGDEGGFTVLEMIIVMSLLLVFLGLASTAVIGMAETAKRTQDRTIAEADLRIAMDRITRDLRAASPVATTDAAGVTYTTTAGHGSEVGFLVFCSTPGVGTCTSQRTRPVRYRLAANVLQRRAGAAFTPLIGADPAAVGVPTAERKYAIVNAATQPVFEYFRSDGSAILPGVHSPQQFRDCTRVVQVRLRMRVEQRNPDGIISLVTRVALRNYNEVSNCITTP